MTNSTDKEAFDDGYNVDPTPDPNACWHCGVVLTPAPKPRCENCPDECDIEGCDAYGCSGASPTQDGLTPKFDQSGLKEACQRALGLGRTHQETDIALVLEMLELIESYERANKETKPS